VGHCGELSSGEYASHALSDALQPTLTRPERAIAQARDALTVKRVFGEPYEKDGVTIIPGARVEGAAGGGSGEDLQGQGKGRAAALA
jgi:hypothetical protein